MLTMKTAIRLPNGKWVSAGQYARAWAKLLTVPPSTSVPGWEWYTVDASDVLRDMRRMLMDIITRHDRTLQRGKPNERRLFTKMDAAVQRGAIRFKCRWCGCELPATRYLQPHARFCDASCQRSYNS